MKEIMTREQDQAARKAMRTGISGENVLPGLDKFSVTEEAMHHAQNGLFFKRSPEGHVRIIKTSDGQNPNEDQSNVVCNEVLTLESFASVISFASKSGEHGGGYYRALDFLKQ